MWLHSCDSVLQFCACRFQNRHKWRLCQETGRGEIFFTELGPFTSLKLLKVILDMLGRTLLVLTSKMKRAAKDISGDCHRTEIVAAEVWQREGSPRSQWATCMLSFSVAPCIIGTLTQNEMVFKRLHLGTVSYGTDTMDEIQSHVRSSYTQVRLPVSRQLLVCTLANSFR